MLGNPLRKKPEAVDMDVEKDLLRHIVHANRILAHQGVVDAYGHVSMRHPDKPDRFLMARSRSPELVTAPDILEYGLDGEPIDAGDTPVYLERYIHAGVYEARPDVNSVVHSHADELIPFTVTKVKLRAMFHTAARLGHDIPVWDIREKFGDTNLLVVNMAQGRDLAKTLGDNRVALMRGHGNVVATPDLRTTVTVAIQAQRNARLQMAAMLMGEITYLSDGEIDVAGNLADKSRAVGHDRAWEYYVRRAGCEDV